MTHPFVRIRNESNRTYTGYELTRILARMLRAVVTAAMRDCAAVNNMRLQSVRWMGRGPTIQGKKTATDAVRMWWQ